MLIYFFFSQICRSNKRNHPAIGAIAAQTPASTITAQATAPIIELRVLCRSPIPSTNSKWTGYMSKRTSSSNVNKVLPDKLHFTKSRNIMVFTKLCYSIIGFIPLRIILTSFFPRLSMIVTIHILHSFFYIENMLIKPP